MLAMHHTHQGGRRIVLLALAGVVIIAAAVGIVTILFPPIKEVPAPELQLPAPAPTTQQVDSRILVTGDVYWGRYINDWSMQSPLKYAYPFSRLSEFKRDAYDAWVGDMECPITNNPKVSSAVEDDTLQFDCSPKYLPEMKKWFTAMTLANNHTDNQGGEVGLAETRQHLEKNGIQYFGSFDPEDHDNICDVIAMPVRITLSDNSIKQGKLPLAWCGYHGVFKIPSTASLAVMKQYERFNIIAMPHSGKEYEAEPDAIKQNLYRSLIDNGAEVVIGDHAHWIQSTEAYKGKLIMYSVGNFIFDQQYNAEVTRSAPLDMTLSVKADGAKDLDQWLALAETCDKYHDDCVAQAEAQGLEKLPLSFHFQVQGSDNSGKLVHRATPAQLESIKQRLRWSQTIQGLHAPQSGE